MRLSAHVLWWLLAAKWFALSQLAPYATSAVEPIMSSAAGHCQLQTLSERRLDLSALQASRGVQRVAGPNATGADLAPANATSGADLAPANATSGAAVASPGATAASADKKPRRLEVAFGIAVILAFLLWLSLRSAVSSGGDPSEFLITDTMTYRMEGLVTWQVFFAYSCTIWDNDALWKMGRRLALLTVAVALLEFLLASDPSSLDPLRFSQIGVVLHIFVVLLLGFFLTSSVDRWFNCVNGFLDLINAIRNLQMQLQALGVFKEDSDKALRLGVLSAWGLNYEMKRKYVAPSATAEAMAEMWVFLEQRKQPLSHLLPEERKLLEGVHDFPGLLWVWVGSLIGRLAQDGHIPHMASPTYGRIIDLAQQAQAGMRQVRSSIAVQMPFAYVHTLATIVHLNNILSAISFGLTLGASAGSILVHIDPRYHLWGITPHPGHYIIQDVQSILIQFFQCFVASIVYLSILEIGLSLASPFNDNDAAIPIERLLEKLERDLQDGNRLAAEPPLWEPPVFQAREVFQKAVHDVIAANHLANDGIATSCAAKPAGGSAPQKKASKKGGKAAQRFDSIASVMVQSQVQSSLTQPNKER